MRLTRIWIALLGPAIVFAAGSATQDPTRSVNIFIGTGGHGHTYPGATVPFGMVQLSPDTFNDGWDWCSGYHYSDSSIMGFSHTHLSGTGVGDMLDVLVMPGTGPDKLEPGTREDPGSGYRSRFSHSQETAEPGYYSVILSDYGIKAELSATERAGIHRYTFPKSDSAHFMVDFAHMYGAGNHVMSSEIRILDDRTIVGGRRVNAWARGRQIFFVMKFSKPFLTPEIVSNGAALAAGVRQAEGTSLKALVHYNTAAGEIIEVKVGISGVSIEGAMRNLEQEIPAWDFDGVRKAAHASWSRELSRVSAEISNKANRTIFYTALYHTMVAPTLFDDVDGQYRGMDGQIHHMAAERAQLQHLLAVGYLPRVESAEHHPHAGSRSFDGELPDPDGGGEPPGRAGVAAPGRRNALHDRIPFGFGHRRGVRERLPGDRLEARLHSNAKAGNGR